MVGQGSKGLGQDRLSEHLVGDGDAEPLDHLFRNALDTRMLDGGHLAEQCWIRWMLQFRLSAANFCVSTRHCRDLRRIRLEDLSPEAFAARDVAFFFGSKAHTSELQSLMRISYAVFCWQKNRHVSSH